MGLTYHADPLHLSPLADLAQVYPSIGSARRMLQDGSRGSVCDKVSMHTIEFFTAMICIPFSHSAMQNKSLERTVLTPVAAFAWCMVAGPVKPPARHRALPRC